MDASFIMYVDLQDLILIRECLTSTLLSNQPLSQTSVDYAFRVSLATENIAILDAILKARYMPSFRLVDEAFMDLCLEGTSVDMIEFIQDRLASPKIMADLHRAVAQYRREGTNLHRGIYLIAQSEQKLQKQLLAKILSSKDFKSKRDELKNHLKSKMFFNDTFDDSIKFNCKFIVNTILRYNSSRPDVVLIDNAFREALVYQGNVSLAIILMPYISQFAIDSSFQDLSLFSLNPKYQNDEVLATVLTFLLSGRSGYVIPQGCLDEAYTLHYQRHDGKSSTFPTTFAQVIEPIVSVAVKRVLRRARAEKNSKRVFDGNFKAPDIHVFSDTTVAQGGSGGSNSISISSSSSSSSSNPGGTTATTVKGDEINGQAFPMMTSREGETDTRKTLNTSILEALRRRAYGPQVSLFSLSN